MRTLLLVEDEHDILESNRKCFDAAGYRVLTAATLAVAREHLSVQNPGAIVLDINMPDGRGLDLLRELREAGNTVPVIMLTACVKPADVVLGLNTGANDYLTKPFEFDVLLARVDTMFRNIELMPERIIVGGMTLRPMSRDAYVNGVNLRLSPKAYDLLQYFVQHRDRSIYASDIYESVWGCVMTEESQALNVAVSRLRKKLKGSGYTINNEYGGVYCFELVEL